MKQKTDSILKEILERINPSKEELKIINEQLNTFLNKLNSRIKKLNAEAFVGGSFAKRTLIKKGKYDIDIFLRFNEAGNLSDLTKKILKGIKNISEVHGSRDYFRVNVSDNLFFEIVPVKKVANPRESDNITDLSYSHVNYVRRKIKSQKILDEIKIAKAFCHAHGCYGAESYVNGFSGYGLELLVYYYGSFEKFVKAMTKIKDKEIIDIEKLHKNKNTILMDLNSAKLEAPIVLIDPTFKQRNVLAALSEETFRNFQKVCSKFLKTPSANLFEIQKLDLEKIRKDAEKKKYEFILLTAKTGKQEGDIAGSKLLKFYNFLTRELEEFFEVKKRGFGYDDAQTGEYFFVLKSRKEILIEGPRISDKKNVARFKKGKKTFVKSGRVYSKKKIDFSAREFITSWKKSNMKLMKDMSILGLRLGV